MNLNKKQENPTSKITLAEDKQYSLWKIIGIWALATAPMTVLAYFGVPAIIKCFNIPASVPLFLVFWPLMIIGMVWQFVLSLIIVYRENGNLKWQTIRKRMWSFVLRGHQLPQVVLGLGQTFEKWENGTYDVGWRNNIH
ncbi:hypothetical protein ES703_111848 [subsurface metagenome]